MELNSLILIDVSGPSQRSWRETPLCSTQESDQILAALPVRRSSSSDVPAIGGTLRRVPHLVRDAAREQVRA